MPGPESGSKRPVRPSRATLPAGYRLVYPRVRFSWARFIHVASASRAVKVTLCGRVSPGRPASADGLRVDEATGRFTYDLDGYSLCTRCAARVLP